ncbi:MAG: DnaJ domain-containing protein [Paenibacillaceae bacterium]|nr:DnaJ domain-containing protein [Paenibacillaceae bacterium]
MARANDYYDVLGVDRKATKETIKKAYKKLAKTYHPDVNKSADAEKRFVEVQAAYDVLSDEEKRASYDRYGEHWREAMEAAKAGYDFGGASPFGEGGAARAEAAGGARGGRSGRSDGRKAGATGAGWQQAGFGGGFGAGDDADLGDLFGRFFGGGAGGGIRFESESGDGFGSPFGYGAADDAAWDVEAELTLTLEEAMRGGKIKLHALGKEIGLTLPASIKDGQRIRLKGLGARKPDGGSGDLYATLRLAPDAVFAADGYDLGATLQVAPWHVALGTTAALRLPGGDSLQVKVPAGMRPGQKLKLAGRGLRKPDGSRGDLYVRPELVLPPADSAKAQELYRELAKEHAYEPKFVQS